MREPDRVLVGRNVHEVHREFRIAKIVAHPERNAATMKHDLAVVILEKDVTDVALPLIASSRSIDMSNFIRVVGFGVTDLNGSTGFGKKRFVDIPIATHDCRNESERYGCHAGLELVAGAVGLGKDANNGDGGGPAYVKQDGRWALAAIVSRATKESVRPTGDGGIYVRLDRYWDWIRNVAETNGGHWRPAH